MGYHHQVCWILQGAADQPQHGGEDHGQAGSEGYQDNHCQEHQSFGEGDRGLELEMNSRGDQETALQEG